jgi:hypothetical protein
MCTKNGCKEYFVMWESHRDIFANSKKKKLRSCDTQKTESALRSLTNLLKYLFGNGHKSDCKLFDCVLRRFIRLILCLCDVILISATFHSLLCSPSTPLSVSLSTL